MALASESTGQNAPGDEEHAGEEAAGGGRGAFDMVSLRAHLPQKRKGLSMHFSGKSRSFTCVGDATRVGDLEKPEIPEAKRRKYMERRDRVFTLFACRAAPGASHCSPCVGV